MTRELLQSFVSRKCFDPEDYAKRIAMIFKEKRIVGYGYATSNAAEKLIAGIDWKNSGIPSPYAGNGSAMRAGSIGIIYWNNPEKCVQIAQEQSIITHKDPRCLAGAVSVAGAVLLCMSSEQINQTIFLSKLYNWVKPVSSDMSLGIKQLGKIIDLTPKQAYLEIKALKLEPESLDNWLGISSFVIYSVLWSLYSFLKSPSDYIEAIKIAIAVGGDVDTTAAMTGAISGAYLGIRALPYNIAKYLNDNGTWNYNQLVQLASECYDLVKY